MKYNFGRIFLAKFALLFVFVVAHSGQASLPIPTSQIAPDEFRFAAIGDSGTGGKKQAKLARVMTNVQRTSKFSLLLFLGDNVYENGSPKAFEKKLIKPYSPLYLRGVEFRGAIGNHDVRSNNGVTLQKMIFNMGINTYYSFSKGSNLIDFFGLDTTLLAKKKNAKFGERQLRWFESEISTSKARWKITFMHHPLYSSAKRHGLDASDEEEMLRVREKLEPVFRKNKIHLSLHGHDHVYERVKPQNGVQYFISGVGGKLRKGNLQKDSPYYGFGNDRTLSFMLFSVKPDTIAFWSIGLDGEIIDSGEIAHR